LSENEVDGTFRRRIMRKSSPNVNSEQLTKATAERVFGWKNVHKRDGKLMGKKQDKAGRWRKAAVPDYAGDQRQAYAIDQRMEQLGRSERYHKELTRISRVNDLPPEWATAEQRSRAALKAIGK
jgi:hypothetical protein